MNEDYQDGWPVRRLCGRWTRQREERLFHVTHDYRLSILFLKWLLKLLHLTVILSSDISRTAALFDLRLMTFYENVNSCWDGVTIVNFVNKPRLQLPKRITCNLKLRINPTVFTWVPWVVFFTESWNWEWFRKCLFDSAATWTKCRNLCRTYTSFEW